MDSIDLRQVVIVFMVSLSAFDWYVDWRQSRMHLIKELPATLKSIVSAEKFAQSQSYNWEKTRFALLVGAISFALEFSMFLYLYEIWSALDFLAPKGEIVQSLVFVGATTYAKQMLMLPFDAYKTFVIEARYGFNKTTLSTYICDLIKSIALQAVFGAPILAGIIAIVRYVGAGFYFYLWIFIVAVVLFMMFVYPTIIQPLFNEFKELEENALRAKIEDLATRVDFPLSKIYVMDGSRRSAHSNAYFYGLPWMKKRIVLYDTLLKQSDDEVAAICGHELGHFKLNHVLKNMLISFAHMLLTLKVADVAVFYQPLYTSFGFNATAPVIIGLTLFSSLFAPIENIVSLLFHMLSRRYEYEADEFSARLGCGGALASALVALSLDNLSAFVHHPLYSLINHSHPTLPERLDRLEAKKKK